MKRAENLKYQVLYNMFKERGIGTQDLALRLGIDRTVLYRKFKGERKFNEREQLTINEMLKLNKREARTIWNYTSV
jgi:hypothetical protein